MKKEHRIQALGLVAAEILARVGRKWGEEKDWQYCILRRRADNDVFVLGPYPDFHAAASAAIETGDTVKPLFREEDLESETD